MKVLLSWLHEFLPTKPSAEVVSEALFSVGTEVNECKFLGEGFEKVVVAKVLEFQKHPNADRLRLCKVSDGTTQYEIVCGASNFVAGSLVALAKVGAKLPNGTTIKASKIRDVESFGMICSESELGMSKETEGILILPSDAPLGTSLGEYLGRSDWLIALELTPNRGDCLSVTGIAREIAASLNITGKIPTAGGEGPPESNLKTTVQDSSGSPRYALRLVEGLTVKPSEPAFQRRLELCGIRPINNVVDITNYVMLERGQPLHAFDRAKVVGDVEVRRAKEGETIVCLDEVERKLTVDDLVIADQEGPIAIAGVMGGLRTAVSETTQAILLESAHFDPKTVRATSRRLILHSESSYRFERWVDPAGVWSASNRAIELLQQLASGKSVVGVDIYPKKIAPAKIRFTKKLAARILGEELKSAGEYLARLGLSIEKSDDDWLVEIPTRRSDLSREIELVEEIARIHGYDKFASALPPLAAEPKTNLLYQKLQDVRTICAALGLAEVVTYSFASSQDEKEMVREASGALRLMNPIDSELGHMRQTLIPSLLKSWQTNRARQTKAAKFFEIARTYSKAAGGETPAKEETHLTALFAGELGAGSWTLKARPADFFDGKGFVESLAQALSVRPITFRRESIPTWLHPGKSATIFWRDRQIGAVGFLHPRLARKYETKDVVLVDLHLDPILPVALPIPKFKPLSTFPMVQRDLAFVVKKKVDADQIPAEIQKLKDPLLKKVELFDVYEGKGLPEDHRSLAYTLTFLSSDRTLTDPEVEASVQKIVQKIESQFSAKLRA